MESLIHFLIDHCVLKRFSYDRLQDQSINWTLKVAHLAGHFDRFFNKACQLTFSMHYRSQRVVITRLLNWPIQFVLQLSRKESILQSTIRVFSHFQWIQFKKRSKQNAKMSKSPSKWNQAHSIIKCIHPNTQHTKQANKKFPNEMKTRQQIEHKHTKHNF